METLFPKTPYDTLRFVGVPAGPCRGLELFCENGIGKGGETANTPTAGPNTSIMTAGPTQGLPSSLGPTLGLTGVALAVRRWLASARTTAQVLWLALRRVPGSRWLLLALSIYGLRLVYAGLVKAPGSHDNDWPLLMWLAMHASWTDPAPLAVGHYGFLQLVLVRLLYRTVGSTLVAAKLLNVVAMVAAAAGAFRLASTLTGKKLWAWLALPLFALSSEAYLTGQSEFGDPLPAALFVWGTVWLLRSSRGRAAFVAGLLWGLGGCVRVHFQMFGYAAALAAAGYLYSSAPAAGGLRLRRLVSLAAGVLVGQAPMLALNLWVHGTLASPIAHTFVGQVLFGQNAWDLASTYASHPFAEVLREHKLRLLVLIGERLTAMEAWSFVLLALGLVGALRRDPHQSGRGFLWLLAAGYYVGVVAPAWDVTHRLLLPFVLVGSVTAVAAAAALSSGLRWRAAPSVTALALALAWLAIKVPGDRAEIKSMVHHSNRVWRQSRELTYVLRAHGLTHSREAFVFDWYRYLIDDPQLVTYYNWGFWNLLVPAFAAERPNPYPTIGDPRAFATFMRREGVRFVVVPKRPEPPFGAFAPVVAGAAPLDGYERLAELRDDVVFRRAEPPAEGLRSKPRLTSDPMR